MRLEKVSLFLVVVLGAGENVHPFQAVVHVVAILDAVDEHRLGQLAVHVGADGVDAVCADEADADIISGLVRLPSTAAQRQGDRKDAASAWADDFLHLAVEPIRPGAALDIDLQLQCGQAGKLGADGSRQAQCLGVGVTVAGIADDGDAVPVLDGGLLLVRHHGLDAELCLNLVIIYHAFCAPRFCQTGSIAYRTMSMLWLSASM